MGRLSIWHWIIVLAVILVLFGGRGKISQLIGDFARGIKAYRKGMLEDEFQARFRGSPRQGNMLPSGSWLWLIIAILVVLVLVAAWVKFGSAQLSAAGS